MYHVPCTIYYILYILLLSNIYYHYTISARQKFMLIWAVRESSGYWWDEATEAQAMRQVYLKSHGIISRFCGITCFPTWNKFPDSAE